MILPLIVPDDNNGETGYSLSQMVRWQIISDECVKIFWPDGTYTIFEGKHATSVRGELVFARNLYAKFQSGIQAAENGPPLIETVGGRMN